MARRNSWRLGDWLTIDEESGMTRYASEITKDGYGKFVTKRFADSRHPQEFVKAPRGEKGVPFSNPPNRDFSICYSTTIGNTGIAVPEGPASHIYTGIGEMVIGCNFVVR